MGEKYKNWLFGFFGGKLNSSKHNMLKKGMSESEIGERKHRYLVRSNFYIYCATFQEFDMYKKRDIEEIQGIIEAIPHNIGFIRNGIRFEGSFDYLCNDRSLNTLEDSVKILKQEMLDKELSLNDFFNYCYKDDYYYVQE